LISILVEGYSQVVTGAADSTRQYQFVGTRFWSANSNKGHGCGSASLELSDHLLAII
jgi:hypothetical protein